MTILHICPGPSLTVATAADDRPTRWCFGCRKHLPHTWRLQCDPLERQPSCYEPVPCIECSRCHDDRTTHPGVYRDGPIYPSPAVWAELVEKARRDFWDTDEWREGVRAGFERERKFAEEMGWR